MCHGSHIFGIFSSEAYLEPGVFVFTGSYCNRIRLYLLQSPYDH